MIQQEQTANNLNTKPGLTARTPLERLTLFIETTLAALGYELVAIEVTNHREKKLRVFIDALQTGSGQNGGVGIEDCVKVTHELDQPLELSQEINEVFSGPYELEVSSPGVDRPLRKPQDFTRFAGEIARLHTFRPLTAEETQASEYSTKNPKQKNFYGVLRGFENEAILFGALPEDGTRELFVRGQKKKPQKKKESAPTENLIRIPLDLVSKANLEPQVRFPDEKEED